LERWLALEGEQVGLAPKYEFDVADSRALPAQRLLTSMRPTSPARSAWAG
jgi:hypothetical protein